MSAAKSHIQAMLANARRLGERAVTSATNGASTSMRHRSNVSNGHLSDTGDDTDSELARYEMVELETDSESPLDSDAGDRPAPMRKRQLRNRLMNALQPRVHEIQRMAKYLPLGVEIADISCKDGDPLAEVTLKITGDENEIDEGRIRRAANSVGRVTDIKTTHDGIVLLVADATWWSKRYSFTQCCEMILFLGTAMYCFALLVHGGDIITMFIE